MYQNLDFAYLVDLSTIDMHFGRFVLRLTLDIEHILRTKLIADFSVTSEDGYSIIAEFLNSQNGAETKSFLEKRIEKIKQNQQKSIEIHSPSDLILQKYGIDDLAIWNIVEIVQFGSLVQLCKFFYGKYPNEEFKKVKDSIFNVSSLRNSAAHNSCLLANLNSIIKKPQRQTIDYLCNHIEKYKRAECEYMLKNRTINDFITSLVVFDKLCHSIPMKQAFYKDFLKFLKTRAIKHKKFYDSNTILTEKYHFVRIIIANILKHSYKETLFTKIVNFFR
ncbi:hypothetical protein DMC01_11000 [Campylobacter troglodytis]|nr:hypothetical protein DMC01_11000 [Campylobacter troglodytis]